MAKTFHLTVARVGENLFEGEALAVHLPGAEGEFTILAGHEAFVSELKIGQARIEAADGTKHHIELPHGGVAEVSSNQATILV
jgi:F-type H+-transporting ATPase subunit epsilon